MEGGVEDGHVRQVRDRGQPGLHRGHGDAVVERRETSQGIHLGDHRGRHENRLPEPVAAVDDAVPDGAERSRRDAGGLVPGQKRADVVRPDRRRRSRRTPQSTSTLARGARSASGARATTTEAGAGWTPAAATGGTAEVSTTLDLSELDPGFNTRTRIARRLPGPEPRRGR